MTLEQLLTFPLPRYATKIADRKKVFLGDVKCHYVFPKNIPNGAATTLTYVRDYFNRMVYSVTVVAGSMGAVSTTVGYLTDETVLQARSGWYLLEDEIQSMAPPQQPKALMEDGHEVLVLD
jgi:hypothetical protein